MELNYLPDDDVLGRCLRVVALRPVLIRSHLCPYQHGELGRVFGDYQVVDTCAADPDRMGIYTQGSYALARAESFHSCV